MRVLTVGNMYPPHHLGGYELMWRASVADLRAVGHEVEVLTTDHREAEPDQGIAEDPGVRRELRWYWREHEVPRLGLRERLALERHNLAVLDRTLERFEPDAICWWAMGGMSLSLLERARRAGVPAVGVVVDEWMVYAPRIDGWQRALRTRAAARLAAALSGIPSPVELAGAARWLFASAYLRERALAIGVEVGAAEVVHPGIDSERFAPAPERPWSGALLCLGRIDPRKGIETALRALASLSDCRLDVVGAGDPVHLAELERLADELGVADRVSFERRPRERIAAAYAEADALLFGVTWPEPFGLVPLEAMAVGTPVIATATGGSGEYLADGRNCVRVAPGDPDELAAAVERLAADPELRARLRAGGLETTAAHDERRFNAAVRGTLEQVAR